MAKRTHLKHDSFGYRLNQALAHRGVSQRGLSDLLGVTRQAISAIMQGKSKSDSLIERAAITLGVSPIWLRTGQGEPPWVDGSCAYGQTYSGLVQVVRRVYMTARAKGLSIGLSSGITAHDIEDPAWRPQPMPLLQLAKELGIKVEFEKTIIDSFRSRMPVSVAMAAAQALQMALANCEEQDREKFRLALNWVEKATSE